MDKFTEIKILARSITDLTKHNICTIKCNMANKCVYCNEEKEKCYGCVEYAMAEYLYNLRYRRVADDEQIVNNKQLNETINSKIKSGKRMLYAKVRDETAREILQELYSTPHEYHEKKIVDLANEYGIELED